MIWTSALDRVVSETVEECSTDLVGLWGVYGDVQASLPTGTKENWRAATLLVIERALGTGAVFIASFDEAHELIPWPTSENAIHRIAQAWDPEDEPSPEDNVWLSDRDLGYRATPIRIR